MALLYFPDRALDDDGNPMPFALMFTRDNAAHSTPKATYSDPDLNVSHQRTNPVVADDAGYFPQCYADTDQAFYLILTAAGGSAAAPYRTYANVLAFGEDGTGAFSRTFADARWLVKSGDTGGAQQGVILEYGSSSPTDTGGFVLEQGWDGTQGTRKTYNFALVEFTGGVEFDGLTITGSTKNNIQPLAAADIDLSASDFFTKSISANTSFTFSNPTAAMGQAFVLQLTISSAAVPTWPASVDYVGGANPSSGLGNGRHILGFITFNGGTDWLMVVCAKAAA